MKTLNDLTGITSDKQYDSLVEAGFDLAQVATASIDELIELDGIGEVTAKKIKAEAQELINQDLVRGQQIAEHEIAKEQPVLAGSSHPQYSVRVARALGLIGQLSEEEAENG